MFSLLAWTRAFAFFLFLFTTNVHAREDTLFTSSVTYCNPPETLLVQRFQVAFYPRTQTVAFNLSAASVQANVNVTANLFLNVYGMKPLNFTLNLCSILDGELCPLPHYNFTGADSIILPNSFGVTEMIPKIAYQIPDLEGFAQFTLTEPSTGIVRACVQATLSNGWSAHQTAVEWSTGGVAIAALIVSALLTIGVGGANRDASDAIAPFRFLDLMQLFQTIASSALLSLNYPSIYRAFALNFAWAIGLFPTSESSPIQNSINALRHRTGSKLADTAGGSVVQFVNRRLSPYNNQLTALGGLLSRRDTVADGEVQTVTPDSDNVLDAGLPIYVNSVNVSTVNVFMTVFLCWLMLLAVTLAALGIGYGLHLLWRKHQAKKLGEAHESTFDYLSFARSWILRISLVSFGPLTIFIFYQWKLKDSWATVLLSVLTFLAIAALIGFPAFLVVRRVRGEDASALYIPGNACLAANGPLYAQYRPVRFYFTGVNLAAGFLRAIIIAFAKSNPRAQVGLLITIEALLVITHMLLRPSKTRGGDVFSTYLAIVRLACSSLLVAFLQPLNINPIPRVVIGIVIAVIFSAAVVVTVINFVINVALHFWPARSGGRDASSESDLSSQGSMLEKGEKGGVNAESKPNELNSAFLAPPPGPSHIDSHEDISAMRGNLRPLNPTPDHSTPIDNSFLSPFPISPTGSTVTTIDRLSSLLPSRPSSGTMTVGSLLSRRWYFDSQPNSPTGSSSAHHGSSNRNSGLHATDSSVGHGQYGSGTESVYSSAMSSPVTPHGLVPPGSSGSSSAGHVTRHSSLRAYHHQHEDIPENGSS